MRTNLPKRSGRTIGESTILGVIGTAWPDNQVEARCTKKQELPKDEGREHR